MIAAAAAKPMTVLRIVLTPLLLEKHQPSGGTQQFRSCCRVRRSASEAEGRVSCGGTFCSITEHGGLYGARAEQVQGFWREGSLLSFGEEAAVRALCLTPEAQYGQVSPIRV